MARATRSKGIQKARKRATKRKGKSQAQLELEKEYKRLRRNLLSQQRYYRQRGMLVYEDVIPPIPKKITTASIKRLQKIDLKKRAQKGEKIPLEKGERFDIRTGEIIQPKVKTSQISEVPYYPKVGIIETIRTRLENMALQTGGYDPEFEHKKNVLINIFEENVAYHEDNIEGLIDYYEENQEEIFSEIDRAITYKSKEDAREREQSFANLARLLNGGSLSRLQAENVSNFGEYFSE